MRLAPALCFAAAVFASPACLVLSVHPAYFGSSLAIDERLLGTWQDPESGSSAIIARGEWQSYRVTFTDRTGTLALIAFETRIGGTRFLDLTSEGGLEQSLLLIPLHGICRISLEGDRLTVAPLDYDWFMRATSTKTLGRVQYAIDERRNVVLSSETSTIRGWIQQHLTVPDFFGPPVVFSRTPTG